MYALILIVVLLCLSLYYNNHTEPKVVPVRSPVQKRPAPVVLQPVSQVDELPSLPLLKRHIPEFARSRRNVFEFSEGSPDLQALAADPEILDSPGPQASASLIPRTMQVVFTGLYREKHNPGLLLAVVSINRKAFVVGQGDIIPGGYKVARIEDDALMLSSADESETLRFPFGRPISIPIIPAD